MRKKTPSADPLRAEVSAAVKEANRAAPAEPDPEPEDPEPEAPEPEDPEPAAQPDPEPDPEPEDPEPAAQPDPEPAPAKAPRRVLARHAPPPEPAPAKPKKKSSDIKPGAKRAIREKKMVASKQAQSAIDWLLRR